MKKITYTEPKGYFTKSMLKTAEAYDKKKAAEAKKQKKESK